MFIPGWLISLLTFPGVIVHEVAHRFFADLAGVEVYGACYFRIGNPAGYVVHGPVKNLKSAFLISFGPMFVNTALCALLTFTSVMPLMILDSAQFSFVVPVLMWVGISIGMHAFPSNQDASNFTDQVKKAQSSEGANGLLLIAAKGLGGLLFVANLLQMFWFDAIYAVGVSMALPLALECL